MIAEILSSSRSFSSVDYNERKVSKGVAELLEMKNFGYLQDLGIADAAAMQKFLKDYSAKNDRIIKTQFHVAISCKGSEHTHAELINIAHQYLEKMGYAKEGQPLLVYGHHDTDNNHIHVITSRVDPQGKKINDSFERVRSQQAIDEIMGVNRDERLNKAVANALIYKFESIPQFKAILESSGYECYEEDKDLFIKRSGVVQGKLHIVDIEKKTMKDYLEDKRKKQLKAIMQKYRDMVSDKEELKDVLRKKFGVDLIFIGSKDTPRGYMVVDHKNKAVYKGSTVLPIKSLLLFRDKDERLRRMDAFIDSMFEDNNKLTSIELNAMLWRQFGTYLHNGQVIAGKDRINLPDYILKTLRRNDKVSWLQSFNPSSQVEREILCKLGKIKDTSLLTIVDSRTRNVSESISTIKKALNEKTRDDVFSTLRSAGITMFKKDDHYYCVDINNKCVFDTREHGIDLLIIGKGHNIHNNETTTEKTSNVTSGRITRLGGEGKAADINREFEVGSRRKYDDIDDERTLKR